ncbi:MAG: hypothetical protein QM677_10905 [Microbacterium sp.]
MSAKLAGRLVEDAVDLPRQLEQAGRKLVPCGGFPEAIGDRVPREARCIEITGVPAVIFDW